MKQDFGEFELGGAGRWEPIPPERILARPPQRPRPAARLAATAIAGGVIVLGTLAFWVGDREQAAPPSTTRPAAIAGTGTALNAREGECGGAPRGAGGAATAPRPIGNPGNWIRSEDYPWWSLLTDQQGVSTAVMRIDSGGAVARCSVARSSGSRWLDGATCSNLQARARYEPARDSSGCPIPAEIRQRVRWQIPAS